MVKAVKKGISHNLNKIKSEPRKVSSQIKKAKTTIEEPIKKKTTRQSCKTIVEKGGVKIKTLVKGQANKLKRTRKLIRSKANPEKLNRGVIYISHLPHGFYEDEMRKYFGQFGIVTAVNMPTSKDGKSRGYAFVEFLHPEVAQVAAETMDNYLMFDKLVKVKYIPPSEQKPNLFPMKKAHVKAEVRRKKDIEYNYKILDKDMLKKFAEKMAQKVENLKKRIEKLGVSYQFQVQHCDSSTTALKSFKKLDPDTSAIIKEGKDGGNSKSPLKSPKKNAVKENKLVKEGKAGGKRKTPLIKKGKVSSLSEIPNSLLLKVNKTLKKTSKTKQIPIQAKDSLKKVKTLTGKVGKTVKRKVSRKGSIKKVKLETDV